MIYTSCYSNRALADNAGYTAVIVRTSLGAPKWPLPYNINDRIDCLTPKGWMLKLEYDAYKVKYLELLEQAGVVRIKAIFQELEDSYPGKDIVLMCYEDVRKAGVWCHRRIFAEWWQAQTGIEIPEYPHPDKASEKPVVEKAPDEPKPPTIEQFSLF